MLYGKYQHGIRTTEYGKYQVEEQNVSRQNNRMLVGRTTEYGKYQVEEQNASRQNNRIW